MTRLNTNYGSKRKLYDRTQIQYEEDLKKLMLHIEAIDDAIQRNYNRILIIDGDNVFHNDLNYLFKKNIESVPEDWQLIFCPINSFSICKFCLQSRQVIFII